ncbi:hypothetical protein L6164_018950 [Bauhinia variegata]|uniref:Uncharacterized protein n=1 Tax=Bauhinia variegata TaxID=167791 RepID=A0ACB9NEU3_BAUVA|nr:hypothetical protein L6164_018950 [Bauhinia variegata]
MEEKKSLTHSVSSWDSRNPTPQIPSSFSFEPNKANNDNKDGMKEKDPSLASEEEVRTNHNSGKVESSEAGRERLKRHRDEVAGRVAIPDKWGQEQLHKDWIDYATFDALFSPHSHRLIVSARDALIEDARKARSQRLRIHTSC